MTWQDKFINKVVCGDCLELLKEIPDKSIDLVLTDPPYGIELEYDIYKDTSENWITLFSCVLPELIRISKCVIMPCCRFVKLKWIYSNYPPDWLICWYKGSVGHRSNIGFNDWEPHLVYGKPNKIMHDYFKTSPTPFNNGHPCPKPIKWAQWFIEKSTNQGDLVLDCFLGSGTTAVACKQLNRNFIGIEISPDYCKIAESRLKAVPEKLMIFEKEVQK